MEKLTFARHRLVESFLCAAGVAFERTYSSLRKSLTKAITMVLIIDDVYGSLEELQCFTNAVNGWDPKEIEGLPECLKTCFEALVGTADEVAYEMAREKGWSQGQPQPQLKKGVTQETMSFIEQNHDLLHNISLIIRLCNDLGTSEAEQERGDAASSVVCNMEEGKVDEEAARKHINGMIDQIWEKTNGKGHTLITRQQQQLSSDHHLPELRIFDNFSTNMARVAHYLYQNGDKFRVQDREDKKQFLSLLIDPFKLD